MGICQEFKNGLVNTNGLYFVHHIQYTTAGSSGIRIRDLSHPKRESDPGICQDFKNGLVNTYLSCFVHHILDTTRGSSGIWTRDLSHPTRELYP